MKKNESKNDVRIGYIYKHYKCEPRLDRYFCQISLTMLYPGSEPRFWKETDVTLGSLKLTPLTSGPGFILPI